MTTIDTFAERRFARLAAENRLERINGVLREKPQMSMRHDFAIHELIRQLLAQLDQRTFQVRLNSAQLLLADGNWYIPDVVVFPTAWLFEDFRRPDARDRFAMPAPFVVEAWSPSTGRFDLVEKIPDYQARGDHEIWRLQPFEHTLTTWRRRDDGTYDAILVSGGTIAPIALPGVVIDLDALFRDVTHDV